MKKLYVFLFLCLLSLVSIEIQNKASAQLDFPTAIKTCESYLQDGSVEYKNEIFNIQITLKKGRNNTCTYKEKIYQGKDHQTLTCNFLSNHLGYISNSMEKYNNTFKKEISKNNIFSAKLTSNGEVFQKYLVDPKYCQITHSKK